MADKDRLSDEDKLALPSLFGKKKRRGRSDDAPAKDSTEVRSDGPSGGSTSATSTGATTTPPREKSPAPAPAAKEPAPAPAKPPASTSAPAPAKPAEPAPPRRDPEPARQETPAARTETPATESSDRTERIQPVTPAPEKAPEKKAPVAAPAAAAAPAASSGTTTTMPRVTEDDEKKAAAAGGTRKAARTRKAPSLPNLGAALAALVTGALVGLLGVVLTFASLKGCDVVTGTDSCGGPGLLVVLAVVVVMILVGRALLASFGVPEAGGLSFLGVAIFVAICLVFLLQQLLEPWMVIAAPMLSALGYATAHWLVNRFNSELLYEDSPEMHDVR